MGAAENIRGLGSHQFSPITLEHKINKFEQALFQQLKIQCNGVIKEMPAQIISFLLYILIQTKSFYN